MNRYNNSEPIRLIALHAKRAKLRPMDMSSFRPNAYHFRNWMAARSDFSGLQLVNSVFDSCNLKESNFDECDLSGVMFLNCELDGAFFGDSTGFTVYGNPFTPGTSYRDSPGPPIFNCIDFGPFFDFRTILGGETFIFNKCSMPGATFDGLDLGSSNFVACELPRSSFIRATIIGSVFRNCSLRDLNASLADFSSASMSNCDMRGANFQDADFSYSGIRNCNLRDLAAERAKLVGVNFGESIIIGANFTDADLSESKFLGCSFKDVILTNAITRNIKAPLMNEAVRIEAVYDAERSNYDNCVLRNADIECGATFSARNALLENVNILGANTAIDLSGAECVNCTINSFSGGDLIAPARATACSISGFRFQGRFDSRFSEVNLDHCDLTKIQGTPHLTKVFCSHCDFEQTEFTSPVFNGLFLVGGENYLQYVKWLDCSGILDIYLYPKGGAAYVMCNDIWHQNLITGIVPFINCCNVAIHSAFSSKGWQPGEDFWENKYGAYSNDGYDYSIAPEQDETDRLVEVNRKRSTLRA